MNSLVFYLGVALLLTHELDAVVQSEWKLLYSLRRLPEEISANVFIALHVPLITVILWLTHHELATVRDGARLVMALFLMVHGGLHYRLRDRPNNTFTSALSLALIYGAGLCGALYITITIVSFQSL